MENVHQYIEYEFKSFVDRKKMKIFKMKNETLFVRVQSLNHSIPLRVLAPTIVRSLSAMERNTTLSLEPFDGTMQRYHALQSSSSFSIFLVDKINDGGCYHSDGC